MMMPEPTTLLSHLRSFSPSKLLLRYEAKIDQVFTTITGLTLMAFPTATPTATATAAPAPPKVAVAPSLTFRPKPATASPAFKLVFVFIL
jgi:hypothetical protein